ncbi:signal peptidase II [Alkalithermobacter paradoxus]|uniref:Lipoprotein signal peptidase n=1 Tax=Alkalithermobacter paradoxus TaxID=29349 RepID=A0A1V4IA69_9FIRM|nr:lipoprotein signal peptidase [[Clostridium] thermoalcaliphilum]
MKIVYILLLILLDQITKIWALKDLSEIGSIPVIENIFHLTYVENRGAAFGIFQGKTTFLVIITACVIGYIIYYMLSNKNLDNITKISFILIISGAIGNLIDRVRLGFVVDFFDFRVWPVFNIADICVVIGAVLLGYVIITSKD